MRRTTSEATGSATPASLRARRQMGWPRRAPRGMTSSCEPVTPRMTLTRRVAAPSAPLMPASSSARRAATSPRSWEVSVASMSLGEMPNSRGSKSRGDRNPPRLA